MSETTGENRPATSLDRVVRVVAPTLVLIAIALMYAPRLIGLFPLGNDVEMNPRAIDDWMQYHEYAKNIVAEGLTMPAVQEPYRRPAGFGYIYFIALIYSIFGANSEVVYFIQGCLLLAAIWGMYAVFREELPGLLGLVFFLSLAVFMWVDLYRYLTFRLLSENLLIALLPLLMFLILRGISTGRVALLGIAGAVCGFCILVRPNVVLFAPTIAGLILLAAPKRAGDRRVRATIIFLCGCAAVVGLLLLRNYIVAGIVTVGDVATAPRIPLRDYVGRETSLVERGLNLTAGMARRVAYVVGLPQFIVPEFRVRPHWLLMWGGFGVYLLHFGRRRPAFWEMLVLGLSASYFLPLLVVAYISNYGFRMLAPGVPLILVLAFKGADLTLRAARERWSHARRVPQLMG